MGASAGIVNNFWGSKGGGSNCDQRRPLPSWLCEARPQPREAQGRQGCRAGVERLGRTLGQGSRQRLVSLLGTETSESGLWWPSPSLGVSPSQKPTLEGSSPAPNRAQHPALLQPRPAPRRSLGGPGRSVVTAEPSPRGLRCVHWGGLEEASQRGCPREDGGWPPREKPQKPRTQKSHALMPVGEEPGVGS